MAYDKVVDSTQLDADLTIIADTIRSKGGTSASLGFPYEMAGAIEDIATDTTAVAGEIADGKTAYISGYKVTGTAALVYDSTDKSLTLPGWTVDIGTAGGGTPVQSGVFTPASQDAKHTITVEDSIAANPFVCIFSVDEEQTPSSLSIVQGVFFVPDPTASLSNVNQWELHSGSSNFISALSRSTTAGTWTASTKKLVLSARGGANFYTAQYSYMIIPLTGLASVWR